MSEKTFHDFDRQVMALYNAKEYTQALGLVEQERQNYPENQPQIAYWRMCLYALLDKQAETLQIFREALEQGHWFSSNWLGNDPDLVSLQALPEFQEMVEICRQRQAEIQATSKPELLVEAPAQQKGDLPLLIALHGNSGNARRAISKWNPITAQGWLLAVPQSSQVFGRDAYVWDDRELAISEIRAHLAKLSGEHNINAQRVVLGGFSMGGGQAVWMALHQSVQTHGFMVLGPYMTKNELEALPTLLETQKPGGVRGYILVGTEDHECLEVSRKLVKLMQAHGLACELEIRPSLDHDYPEDFSEVVSRGLAFIEQA